VSNCTAGATFQQFVALVEKGIIRGLCTVLKMKEARILAVALEGLENVLKSGKSHYSNVSLIYS
jgi:importin subunit alpha-6/7